MAKLFSDTDFARTATAVRAIENSRVREDAVAARRRPKGLPRRAWITLIATIPWDPTPPNRWKYRAHVLPHPFAHLLDPAPPYIAENVIAFNALEVGNTEDKVWGLDITPGGTCGSIDGVVMAHISYQNYPLEAELRWTYFESGDPDDGYWAWWFSAPNMVTPNN